MFSHSAKQLFPLGQTRLLLDPSGSRDHRKALPGSRVLLKKIELPDFFLPFIVNVIRSIHYPVLRISLHEVGSREWGERKHSAVSHCFITREVGCPTHVRDRSWRVGNDLWEVGLETHIFVFSTFHIYRTSLMPAQHLILHTTDGKQQPPN